MLGTIGQFICYPFLFSPAFVIGYGRDNFETVAGSKDQINMTIYYSVIAAVQNLAWAFVQISHLAMIPEITLSENSRGSLTAIRNVGAVVSNIFVYCITWIMLGIGITT